MKSQKSFALVLLVATFFHGPAFEADAAVALSFGSTNTGTLSLPGQEHRFTFTGTAGQRLYYDALDNDFDAINAQLISPSGGIVSLNGNSDTDVGLFTLPETGNYTVSQKASVDYTGDYSFRLLDLALAPAVTYGVAVTNTLNPQTSAQVYRLNGTAGQRIGITNLAVSSNSADWAFVGPNNAVLLSGNIQSHLGSVTLPVTGTYALLVAGAGGFVGGLDYQFRVSLISSASGGTSGFGVTRSGGTTAGQTNSFSYTAPAGLPVYFDALTNDAPVTVEFIGPSGNAAFTIGGASDAGPYFLPESGSYTLNVVGFGDGTYNLRLLNLNADSTSLSFGTPYTQTLNPGFRTEIFRFTGTNGQRIYYDAMEYDGDAVAVQLINPSGAIVFINHNADSDAGPFTLIQAGTYYLAIISQLADNTADYSFRLMDVSQAPAKILAFDTIVNGTNTPPTSASIYRFTGTNGQRLFFDFAATNIGAAYVNLYGPHNQGLNSYAGAINTDFEQTLPGDGTYILSIGNNTDESATNFSFRVVTSTTTTNALALGQTVSGLLDEPGEEGYFTFTGTAGQRLYYDALDGDFDSISVQLISPGGVVVFINGNSDSDVGPFTLTETGSYAVVQKGNGDYTNDYSFRLLDLLQLPAKSLTLNATVNGTNQTPFAASLYSFNGTAAQRLFFDFAATNSGSAAVALFGPGNQSLNGYTGGLNNDFEQTLPINGAYVLAIGNYLDTSLTNLSFRVLTPDTTTNALTLGLVVTGDLTGPGEEHRFTFVGTAGQSFYYDDLDGDFDSINVQLIGPGGMIVFISGNSDSDVGPFTLNESGAYTLLQKGSGDFVSDYRFRLIDVSQSPAKSLTLNTTVTGTNLPPLAVSVFRFTGSNGQRLFFDFASTNLGSASANLYGPDNQLIYGFNGTLSHDFEQNLTSSGTFILTIGNQDDPLAENFSLRVLTPGTTTTALTLGATTMGTLAGPGEEHRFTLSGTVGQRVYYDALDHDFDEINVQLIDPSGNTLLINGNSDNNFGLLTLNESGVYTLLQKGYGDYVGDYRFRLLNLAAAPAITYGVVVTNQIAPQISTHLYRINGTAGERIGITNLAASSLNANWKVVGPDNASLLSNNIDNDLGAVTLPVTGTYALVVEGAEDFSGGLDYQFDVSLLTSASGGISGFGMAQSGGTTTGQTNSFGYTAPAGLPVYFDALNNSSPVTVEFVGPSGNAAFTIAGASDAGPFFLPESGIYTLNVIGSGDGTYDFRLLDLTTDSTELTFGTSYTEPLSPAFRTDVYRFTGSAGQRLYYDAQEYDGDAVLMYLFNPSGTLTAINGNSDSDLGPFTLTGSGIYYLAIISQLADDTADYHFRLIDVSQLPATTLTLDTPVNGTNDPTASASVYRFTGTAGQRLFFDFASTNIGAAYGSLYGPQDQYLGGNGYWLFTDFEQTLPSDGTYILIVGNNSDGNASTTPFSFSVVTPNRVTNALILAATVASSLDEPGEEDRYTFTGTAGQRLYYDGLDADNDGINVQLISPAGAISFVNGNSDTDVGPFTLTETGTYTVLLKASGDYTNDYSFRLIDVAQSPARSLTFDTTVHGTNLPTPSVSVYRFTGTNGQRLFFDFASTNVGAAYAYLYGPQNQYLNGNGYWLFTDFEQTLPADGTYILTVGNNSDGNASTTPFSFRVVTPNTTTNALSLGVVVTGSLGEPGEEDRYTFAGTAGQRLYYDALDGDGDNLLMTLFDPVGTGIISLNAESDHGPLTLPFTGTYTVLLKGGGDALGIYRFRLLDTATAPVILNDVTVTNVIAEPRGVVLYRFSTMATLRMFTDWLSSSDPSGYFTIFAPNNATITGNSFGNDSEFTPALSDSYLIVLSSSVASEIPYSFQLIPGNHAPAFAAMNAITNNEMMLLTITNIVTDPEAPNDQVTFRLLNGPPNAAFNPATGVFTWTPDEDQGPGVYPITVSATDDGLPSLSSTNTYSITVNEVNRPPMLTVPGTQTIDEQTALSVSASATDPDIPINTLTFSLQTPPSGMTIHPSSGAISWTPSELQGPSTNTITVVVTDFNPPAVNTKNLSATNSFTVIVREINTPPVLPLQTNRMINELTLLTVTNAASDSDLPPNSLGYVLSSPPSGMSIDTNGVITWIPAEAQGPGTFTVTTIVTDTNSAAVNTQNMKATNSFMVTVNEVNVAPMLNVSGTQTIDELTTLVVTNTATDSDLPTNSLTFSLVSPPVGMIINPTNGVISWTPSEAQGPSSNTITVVVTDTNSVAVNAQSLSTTNSFTVLVREINVPPVLTLPPGTNINELVLYTATATATDSDLPANVLTFALVSGPGGLTVSPGGAISWTPTELQGPSTNVVTIKVTDNNPDAINAQQISVTNSYMIVVNEVNVAPLLTLPPGTNINELVLYTATATATDSDLPANALTFALVSGPGGLTVSPSGAISWTPTEAQGPSTNVVAIKVTDNNPDAINAQQISVTNSYVIVVNEVNVAPMVGAVSDRMVNPGQTVSFIAPASDTDLPANILTFSLLNPPAGAAIDSGSGAFSWRPTIAQAKTTNTVQVKVTDNGVPSLSGTNSFTIIVNPLAPTLLTPVGYSNGVFTISATGSIGPDYIFQRSSTFAGWTSFRTNTPASMPFSISDTNSLSASNNNYRVLLGP